MRIASAPAARGAAADTGRAVASEGTWTRATTRPPSDADDGAGLVGDVGAERDPAAPCAGTSKWTGDVARCDAPLGAVDGDADRVERVESLALSVPLRSVGDLDRADSAGGTGDDARFGDADRLEAPVVRRSDDRLGDDRLGGRIVGVIPDVVHHNSS